MITAQNTVIVPVKTGAASGFRVDAHSGTDGTLQWSLPSDYVLPPHNWVPEFGPVLTPTSRLYFPGAGGTVYYRDSPDSTTGPQGQIAFYGLDELSSQSAAVRVGRDDRYAHHLRCRWEHLFRIPSYRGHALKSSKRNRAHQRRRRGNLDLSRGRRGRQLHPRGDAKLRSRGERGPGDDLRGCEQRHLRVSLAALNSTTLKPVAKVRLIDPFSGLDATLSDEGSATPTVGVDGDVYYGVLENPVGRNHYRGWLLHFDGLLAQTQNSRRVWLGRYGFSGPSFMAPAYTGAAPYLLMTKYNDYANGGGNGQNKIAVLDPNSTERTRSPKRR